MSTDVQCPRCTVLNHTDNDECYICGLRFGQNEGQLPNNDELEQQPILPVASTKTKNKSILETIWAYFILTVYTTYTIVVAWTSETIIKIIAYLFLLLAVYIACRIFPYAVKMVISAIKGIKYFVSYVIKSIFEVRTNPLVWITISVVIAWCFANTLDIKSIAGKVINLEIDVNYLKIDVHQLKDRVNDLEFGLDALKVSVQQRFEELGDSVKRIDETVDWATKKMNETYTPWIEKGGWLEPADTYLRETMYSIFSTLTSNPLSRRDFGLGCFVKGSKIQVDEFGNTVNVEQLRDGDYVFSPVLNEQIKIKTFIAGDETGFLYEIMTKDLLTVTVTETHPMKICAEINNVFDCNNIAAQNISRGNWTQTINGYQQIISVQKMKVQNVMVYNFMLDVVDNTQITSRAVIANGIYSLDLFAQQQHH